MMFLEFQLELKNVLQYLLFIIRNKNIFNNNYCIFAKRLKIYNFFSILCHPYYILINIFHYYLFYQL